MRPTENRNRRQRESHQGAGFGTSFVTAGLEATLGSRFAWSLGRIPPELDGLLSSRDPLDLELCWLDWLPGVSRGRKDNYLTTLAEETIR